jgi:hypothetical protein
MRCHNAMYISQMFQSLLVGELPYVPDEYNQHRAIPEIEHVSFARET